MKSSIAAQPDRQFNGSAAFGGVDFRRVARAKRSVTVALLGAQWLLSASVQADAQTIAGVQPASAVSGSEQTVDSSQLSARKRADVEDAGHAWQNFAIHCQGCHRADGQGAPGTFATLASTVAKFLWVPGGREYLVQVPGVATSELSDDDLAAVVNWMVLRFDKQHVPASFEPYTGAEVGRLRAQPLRVDTQQTRDELLRKAEELVRNAEQARSL